MDDLLREAFAGQVHVLVCGVGAARLFPRILALKDPRELTLVITDSLAGELPAGCQILAGASRLDLLRAALRQDPDCVALDLWSPEVAEMVLQTAFTGHRLVLGCPEKPPAEFLEHGLPMVVVELDAHGEVRGATRQGAEPVPPEPFVQPPATVPEQWPDPRPEPLRASLEKRLGPLERTCWIPQLGPGDDDPHGSKFGGVPALTVGESWPRCSCGERMQLVVQLDRSELPAPHVGTDYFQLFYCTARSCSVSAPWEPFQGNSLARNLPRSPVVAPAEPPPEGYGQARIAGWRKERDFPHSEERPALPDDEREAAYLASSWAAILAGDAGEATRLAALVDYYAMASREELGAVVGMLTTYPGDKLGGWPCWTQAADYPACSACGLPMEMWLQINNDGGEGSFFGQLFAADGNGHVFQCCGRMGFAWACG